MQVMGYSIQIKGKYTTIRYDEAVNGRRIKLDKYNEIPINALLGL